MRVDMPQGLRRNAPSEVSVSRKYELVGRLDQGGMGEIFLARVAGTAGFSREVVIKRLRRALAAEPRAVTAFVEEARLLASMSHPNVCQVHDLIAEEGQLYLVMEYLHGLPLSDVMARGPIEMRNLCGIAVQVCEGLHHVHSLRRPDGRLAGAIHRDISPSNLFVTSSGQVVILDFGIAKTFDSAQLTPCHVVKGKRAFMSPEQLGGQQLDARTDLYSLGVVLSDVTGSEELDGVIHRALEILPQDRFGSAREMREAIERAAAAVGGAAAPSDLADWLNERFADELAGRRERVARTDPTATGTIELRAPSAERAPEMHVAPAPVGRPRRRRGAIAGLAAVAAAALLIVALSSSGEAEPVAASSSPATPTATPTPTPTLTAIPTPTPTPTATPTPIPIPEPNSTPIPIPEPSPMPATPTPTPIPEPSSTPATPTSDSITPPSARARAARTSATGYLTIVSTPFAYVTANGSELGMTPIWRAPQKAGRVRIEAVRADGRRTSFSLTVAPGSEVRRRVPWSDR